MFSYFFVTDKNPHFPLPSNEAILSSEQLRGQIIQNIAKADGWINFAQYMEQVLYTPYLGYYQRASTTIGMEGDFITAPSCSAWFGYSLAELIRPILHQSAPYILECGAGAGHLAADLLTILGEECVQYHILELSPSLREQQRAMLAKRARQSLGRVVWLDRLPTDFKGCVVANEVLDAMPVHLLERAVDTSDGLGLKGLPIVELGVGLISGVSTENSVPRLGFVPCPVGRENPQVQEMSAILPIPNLPGYRTELGLAGMGWVSTVSDMLKHGGVIIVDYGFSQGEYYHPQRTRGTLLCHYRHHIHDDPFWMPGLCDVTAHLEFESLASRAQQGGLQTLYYATQANFLLEWGADILQNLMKTATAREHVLLSQQAQYLTSPAQMGDVFKLLLLGRGIKYPAPPVGIRRAG